MRLDRPKHPGQRGLKTGAALIAVGFVLAGCGSSGSSAPPATPSSAAAAQTSTSASAAAPSAPAASSAAATAAALAGAGSGLPFCQYAKVQQSQQAAELKAFTSDSPQQLEAFENQALAALTKFTSTAPAAIRSDVQVLVGADQKLFAALKAAKFDYTKLSPTALGSFDTPALTKASQAIVAYLGSACGIKATP